MNYNENSGIMTDIYIEQYPIYGCDYFRKDIPGMPSVTDTWLSNVICTVHERISTYQEEYVSCYPADIEKYITKVDYIHIR